MKGDIRRRKQANKDERFQIAPIAPHDDLPGHDHEEAGEKRTVDQHRRKRTYDADGEITGQFDPGQVGREEFGKLIPRFMGEIEQKIPPYSATKRQGKKFHRGPRKGNLPR